jgi:MFS family permease
MATATERTADRQSSRSWRDLSVRLAIALAFADASIVVLALPQVVGDLHTTVSRVTWVIMAYNLALIVGVFGFVIGGRRVSPRPAMLAGLALFGLASLGCGASDTLLMLVAFRCLQGVGGGLIVCASLPLLAMTSRLGHSNTASWAASAAIGAAAGPAAGGILTQVFDWRAIFLAQAPASALAAAAILSTRARSTNVASDESQPSRHALEPAVANVALLLLSAALIGALFLVVLLLIDVWRLAPIAAAGVVSALPVTTTLFERVARGRSPPLLSTVGTILLAIGLVGVTVPTHRELGWVFLALTLAGAGLGMSFTALTDAALKGGGTAMARAARTVAARDAGLVLGLLILTPVFVHDLNDAPKRALPALAIAIYGAPMSNTVKDDVTNEMFKAYAHTPQAQSPDFGPAFAAVRAKSHPDPATARTLTRVQQRVDSAVERAATQSFHRSLRYCALFALVVLLVLGLARTPLVRRRAPNKAL